MLFLYSDIYDRIQQLELLTTNCIKQILSDRSITPYRSSKDVVKKPYRQWESFCVDEIPATQQMTLLPRLVFHSRSPNARDLSQSGKVDIECTQIEED